jgi:thiamine biosynthesis lipoprotein
MGTTARLFLFNGPANLENDLRARLTELEQHWNRFVDNSEVSLMNRADGRAVKVTADTMLLVQRALSASRRTGGWFDPTLLHELEAAGYDRPFADLPSNGIGDLVITVARHADGDQVQLHDWNAASRAITVDPDASTVAVPSDVGFDPGGVGKGLAADLIAKQAQDAGVAAVLVDLGGDIVTAGQAPPGGWRINLEDPFDRSRSAATVNVPWGAVATSSRANRRWKTDRGEAHHLIDPSTRSPSTSDVAACTVVGGECWLAESYAKAAVLAGVDAGLGLLDSGSLEGLIIDADGHQHTTMGMVGFLS